MIATTRVATVVVFVGHDDDTGDFIYGVFDSPRTPKIEVPYEIEIDVFEMDINGESHEYFAEDDVDPKVQIQKISDISGMSPVNLDFVYLLHYRCYAGDYIYICDNYEKWKEKKWCGKCKILETAIPMNTFVTKNCEDDIVIMCGDCGNDENFRDQPEPASKKKER